MNIQKIDFTKTKDNKTILTDKQNIEKLIQWVLPIIEQNEGWGSADLTKEKFLQNPQHFQDEIDATVWKNVHILLENNQPIGLLEFGKTNIDEPKDRHTFLNELFEGKGIEDFNKVMGKQILQTDLLKAKEFLINKPIYTAVGVVLKPDLQNQKTGYADKLYELISDGLVFGMTSNPVIVRKRKTQFKNTLFFPLLGEYPTNHEKWAVCLYVYAYVKSHAPADYKDLEFGAMYSPYFVEDRGTKYLELAQHMKNQGKITQNDERRIQYILSKHSCAGAIISWN